MAVIASPKTPSSSNLQGGFAGIMAAMAVGFLSHSGYLAIAATAIGMPEATIAVVATGIVGMVVNIAVTHVAELKNADEIIREFQSITTTQDYSVTQQSPLEPTGSNNQKHAITNLKSGGK